MERITARDDCFPVQVREIIGKRELRGRTLYKISWEGFSSDEDSWEPETNLIGCEPLIDEFNRRSWSPSPVPPEPSPKVRQVLRR